MSFSLFKNDIIYLCYISSAQKIKSSILNVTLDFLFLEDLKQYTSLIETLL